MSIREYIRRNRDAIDAVIHKALKDPARRLNDDERRMWILNDEGLYLEARASGVKV